MSNRIFELHYLNYMHRTHIKMCLKMWCHSTIQKIHENFIFVAFQRLFRDQQWPVHLFSRASLILITLSIEALHLLHPSSGDQDYYSVVRDTWSSQSYRTKLGPSGSPFMRSLPFSLCCLSERLTIPHSSALVLFHCRAVSLKTLPASAQSG